MTRYGASYSTSILQRISAGNQFDGTLSGGAESTTRNGSVYEFAADNNGGLFFWETKEPIVVDQIIVNLGASGTVTVNLVNLDSNNAPIAGETWQLFTQSDQQYLALNETNFKYILLPGQAIQIISSGSAAAKIAQVYGMIERFYTH